MEARPCTAHAAVPHRGVACAGAATCPASAPRLVGPPGGAGGTHRMATFSSFASMVPEPSVSNRSNASLQRRAAEHVSDALAR